MLSDAPRCYDTFITLGCLCFFLGSPKDTLDGFHVLYPCKSHAHGNATNQLHEHRCQFPGYCHGTLPATQEARTWYTILVDIHLGISQTLLRGSHIFGLVQVTQHLRSFINLPSSVPALDECESRSSARTGPAVSQRLHSLHKENSRMCTTSCRHSFCSQLKAFLQEHLRILAGFLVRDQAPDVYESCYTSMPLA